MQWHGLLRWLWPQNLVLTGLTEYTRTQIMAETIDDTFFQGNTFSALDPTLPVILINATELSPGGCSMVFSAENFNAMHADLSAYPIANAVMASGAFPGAFNPITLSNWASPVQRTWLGTKRATWFRHLYDGGPSDNLGTDALLREVNRLRDDGIRVRDCFLFVIDAFPDAFFSLDKPETSDSRSLVDFFVDTNALTASDTLLAKARLNQLQDLGIANPRTQSFHQPDGEQGGFRGCTIRLIALQHLKALRRVDVVKQSEASRFSVCKKEGMACLVNSIPTAYKLSNAEDRNQTSDDVQAALFEAAHELVWQDALPPSANTSFTVEQVGNPTMMAMSLRQGSDPVSLYLRERLTEKQRDILQRSCCQKSSRELTVAILEFLRNEQHDSGLWSPQRFRNVNLRDQTKVLLAGSSLKDDQLLLLNRLLLEDAYPDLLDRTRNVHKSTCRWFSNNGMPLQGCA